MEPTWWITSCWNGFLMTYEIRDNFLFLKKLEICLTPAEQSHTKKVKPKKINGKLPRDLSEEILGDEDIPFEYLYEDLDLKIPFTGGLVIAKGFISRLYVHMGFHPPWKYTTVYELIFKDGRLLEERDISLKMTEIREEMMKKPLRPGVKDFEVLANWIDNSFSRKYDFDEDS